MASGFGPYDLLLAALGACSAMTMRLYAERKGWPLSEVRIELRHAKIHASDCADCETRDDARIDEIGKRITLAGPLDAEQRARLVEIAGRCPVHRTLESEMKIRASPAANLDLAASAATSPLAASHLPGRDRRPRASARCTVARHTPSAGQPST